MPSYCCCRLMSSKKENYHQIRFTTSHNALRCDIGPRYILILRDFRPFIDVLKWRGLFPGRHLNIVSLIIKLKVFHQPPSFTSFMLSAAYLLRVLCLLSRESLLKIFRLKAHEKSSVERLPP